MNNDTKKFVMDNRQLTLENEYSGLYTSYSGCDIIATITVDPTKPPLVLGELQTISYSIHREITPVRTIGRINPVGFAKGQRTIAGSLIFTVFDRNILHEIKTRLPDDRPNDISVADELPPFDINIIMQNEYGQTSHMKILGVVIIDEGQVMSIEDMLTENTMSYMATDIVVLRTLTGKEQEASRRNAMDIAAEGNRAKSNPSRSYYR